MSADPKTRGRVLALDLGAKTIGLAVSDEGRTVCRSLGVIRRTSKDRDVESVIQAMRENQAVEIVLGLPLHLSGQESEGSRRSRRFAAALEKALGHDVALVDESFSTAEAEEVLIEADVSRKRRKKKIDGLAAANILQYYLNELAEREG